MIPGPDADVAPILFTWPSAGNVFAYEYDRDSANYSRDDLEKLLRYLQNDPEVKTISILAHSMGNWVTLEALRQMAIRDGRVAPKVKLVMLADADVDVDIAREQIATLGPEHPHIVLFVHENDRALAASKDIWDAPRLGAIDPDVEPYKSMIEQDQLSVINMTHFPSHDFFNHGKFAEDPNVVELIGRRLAAGQVLTDRRVGLGARIMQVTSGAAGSVGHAAGLAISAPVSIVDPETRNHFGDQVGRSANPCDASDPTVPSEGAAQRRARGKRGDLVVGSGLVVGTAAPRSDRRRACLGDRLDREDARAHRRFGPAQARRASSSSSRSRRSPARSISGSRRRPGRVSISGSAPCPTGGTRCSIRSARSPATVTPTILLEDRWRLLGAIEAVNGLILFGLTTAFLYAAIHEVWPLRRG